MLYKFQCSLHRHKVNQITILYCLRKLIAISRNTVLQFKDFIGIFVNFIFWSSCQPNQRSIKIIKNIPVFIVNGTMCFITDHQIKMSAGKQFSLFVLNRIYTVYHGLISRKNTMSCIVIFLFAQICNR